MYDSLEKTSLNWKEGKNSADSQNLIKMRIPREKQPEKLASFWGFIMNLENLSFCFVVVMECWEHKIKLRAT